MKESPGGAARRGGGLDGRRHANIKTRTAARCELDGAPRPSRRTVRRRPERPHTAKVNQSRSIRRACALALRSRRGGGLRAKSLQRQDLTTNKERRMPISTPRSMLTKRTAEATWDSVPNWPDHVTGDEWWRRWTKSASRRDLHLERFHVPYTRATRRGKTRIRQIRIVTGQPGRSGGGRFVAAWRRSRHGRHPLMVRRGRSARGRSRPRPIRRAASLTTLRSTYCAGNLTAARR